MYLSKLKIVNFRNNKNTNFDFSKGVNTIIGENDSGKTNAITAIKMLLDESYYLSLKNLKPSDFSFGLDDWRGHWIIISSEFLGITREERSSESVAEICMEMESRYMTSNMIGNEDNKGYFTLFIRPNRFMRLSLHEAIDLEEFNTIRKSITLDDYEISFRGRASTDFSDMSVYNKIVGNFETGKYADPSDEDESIVGHTIDSRALQSNFSIITIDALRDVEKELRKGRNPIRRMIESIQSSINEEELNEVRLNINNLNSGISNIAQIKDIGTNINTNLDNMIGTLYSPVLMLESQMNNEITQLSKYISLKPEDLEDINLLGLGRLNMIYIALKLAEFNINKKREIINIMLIEEPEAHIHNHIQRTLFNNMETDTSYTQVILTTHSVHISEVSEISKLNVMKISSNESIVMKPSKDLDQFGKENLNLGSLSLTTAVERYLDTKRSVLMFSKSILLVEGDGEELLIPNLVRKSLGVTLDELGIGIINIGSVAFEYIAPLFSQERIQKKCAILTDLDQQAVNISSKYFKEGADSKGKERKERLEYLFSGNDWVEAFYSTYTLEIDFIEDNQNKAYVSKVIDDIFQRTTTITSHKGALMSHDREESAEEIFKLADKLGKGWYSTLLSEKLDYKTVIPEYIVNAIAFSAKESLTIKTKFKMINYFLKQEESHGGELIPLIVDYESLRSIESYENLENMFIFKFPNCSVSKLLLVTREMQVN